MMDRRCSAASPILPACPPAREWVACAQNIGQADDGIHRGADFVAHVGQECALGNVGCLGLFPRFVELGGAFGDKLLKVVTVLVEFAPDPTLFGDVFLDRDIVSNGAVSLADRRHDGELDILLTVLASVEELAFPRFALGE
jgi:hypothetical protein